MPPTSDGDVRTVGCALARLVPDAGHLDALRRAVESTHRATLLATELLNLHLRRVLVDPAVSDDAIACFFDANWLMNAYHEVTTAPRGKARVVPALHATLEQHMPPFAPPIRTGIVRCLAYECRNLAAVASNNVWMHLEKRVLSHVRNAFALDEVAYAALTTEQRRRRKLELMQMAADVCRNPSARRQAPANRHAWVDTERARLGIDAAVGEWKDKPLKYHAKARPHRFVRIMRIMSSEREAAGGRAFALYPLRRSYVPRHVRFDQHALRDLLRLGKSEHAKQIAKAKRQKTKTAAEPEPEPDADAPLAPLQPDGAGYESPVEEAPAAANGKRKWRSRDELAGEKAELCARVLDLRAAGVTRRHRFDFAFTTDGVGARVQMRTKPKSDTELAGIPTRGVWAIDQLKRASRLEQLHVVGVDPGKRELVCCVDMDDPKASPVVRYTQKQRARDLRSRQYVDEARRDKSDVVIQAETVLSGYHSRSADLERFAAYCAKRHETLDDCLAFYGDLGRRQRRWKTVIKAQQSEERLYQRIEGLKSVGDSRPLVLAYGSWGMVAGRPGAACNRGNPPCVGVGLMRRLARRFVVAPTPEAYTSKTCCRCLGSCGPWSDKEEEMGWKIRGLRRCQNEECMLPLNRDKNGATNIGTNFKRLFKDRPPIRSMSDEDLAFHRAALCLECED
mgnify:FL=1